MRHVRLKTGQILAFEVLHLQRVHKSRMGFTSLTKLMKTQCFLKDRLIIYKAQQRLLKSVIIDLQAYSVETLPKQLVKTVMRLNILT